jgi:hypothetical protein
MVFFLLAFLLSAITTFIGRSEEMYAMARSQGWV